MKNQSHKIQIAPVNVIQQHGQVLLKFQASASMLLKHGKVYRFGESTNGIQRKLDQRHANDIFDAMVEDPNTLLIEPIFVHLEGEWVLGEGVLYTDDPDAYMSIDDGGHRHEAMKGLNGSEQKAWIFDVTAVQGLTKESRMVLFRQQQDRKPIDARLNLAHTNFLGNWKSEMDREAYAVCTELNGNPNSPLYRQVIMEETVIRPMERQHRPTGINVVGLMSTLKRVLGKHSVLSSLPREKRQQLVMSYIDCAKQVWPKQWSSDTHVLKSARGIRALLLLITNGTEFGRLVGTEPTIEKMRGALALARTFDWSAKNNVNASEKQIMERLDQSIGRNKMKQTRSASS